MRPWPIEIDSFSYLLSGCDIVYPILQCCSYESVVYPGDLLIIDIKQCSTAITCDISILHSVSDDRFVARCIRLQMLRKDCVKF